MALSAASSAIYNSTFTIHRLSPLYVAQSQGLLSSTALSTYARRLTEVLKGDIDHGLDLVDAGDEDTSRLGSLKKCRWANLGASGAGDTHNEDGGATTADGLGLMEGIRIDIEYERASYSALLLRDAAKEQDSRNSEYSLPLLFTRMPAPVRTAFLDFLAVTFDTRAESLRLNVHFIGDALENFISELSEDPDSMESIVKEVQLSLGFKKPVQASLRTLDIAIPREDVGGFLAHGKTIKSSSSGGSKTTSGPFMTALREYFATHLALNVDHDQVFISRVACGAFALGKEGKVKLFAPAT
ncbi:MAG: hypothetical protein LQ340_007042, partial [Diploschistes diacapsis]